MTVEYQQPLANRNLPDDLDKLEFDEWKQLFESDPDLFEYYRKQLLEKQVELAPESAKPRLRGLIFQMEAEAVRSRTPLAYCIRLSAMMMDEFDKLRQQLTLLTGPQEGVAEEFLAVRNSAEIIPLERYQSRGK